LTKDEAITVLAEIKLLREAVDILEEQAKDVLRKPDLKLVKDDDGPLGKQRPD